MFGDSAYTQSVLLLLFSVPFQSLWYSSMMNRAYLKALSRPDLQRKAKTLGVKANVKTDKLIEDILDASKRYAYCSPGKDHALFILYRHRHGNHLRPPNPSITNQNSDNEDEHVEQMPAPAGPSRTRAASSRPDAVERKPSASRGRVQMSEEPQPTKRVVSGQHGRAASTTTTVAAPSTSKIGQPRIKTLQPLPKASARQLDEDYALSSSDGETSDQRVSRPTTAPSRIPVQATGASTQKRPATYKSVRGKKALGAVSGAASSSDDDDNDSSKPSQPTRPAPLQKSRPSLSNQVSTPYVELARRPSVSGTSPLHTNSSSRDMPPPQNLPVKTQTSRPVEGA